MSEPAMIKRAETMVLWYRDLPDRSTQKTDREIALALHIASPGEGWAGRGNPTGNVSIVRRTRRWIDKQREGPFAGYSFGTRRNGSGATWSNLNTPEARVMSATIGTSEQLAAVEQASRAEMEGRARRAMKLNAEAEEWFQLGDFQRSMVCRDAANEVEQYGHLRQQTQATMQILGLVMP